MIAMIAVYPDGVLYVSDDCSCGTEKYCIKRGRCVSRKSQDG